MSCFHVPQGCVRHKRACDGWSAVKTYREERHKIQTNPLFFGAEDDDVVLVLSVVPPFDRHRKSAVSEGVCQCFLETGVVTQRDYINQYRTGGPRLQFALGKVDAHKHDTRHRGAHQY